jgi:2-C-methyl-D-erythritol 4-phosphate cytidylyltransferase
MTSKYWVVIPAAGSGRRFGSHIPKQYFPLNGKPVIEHTLSKFLYHSKIQAIVIVVNDADPYWRQLRLDAYGDRIIITQGGAERSQSVLAGLKAIENFANPQDFILVHDAVRPCIHPGDIDNLIATVGTHPVGGILGSKVRDTLKYASTENQIVNTVPRENIWQALTPQMFRYQLLSQALNHAINHQHAITDEAQAIESLGFVPLVVEGRRDNIKITFPEDLAVAEKYLI